MKGLRHVACRKGVFSGRGRIILLAFLTLYACFSVTSAMARDNAWAADSTEGDWQYKYLDDGTVEVVGYLDVEYEGVLTVPGQLDGKMVAAISGVNYMKNVTEIILPETIRIIGNNAFAGNVGMERINLPEGITSIGEWAFHSCRSLHQINLPEGLTEIRCFTFCDSGLDDVVLPESVTLIDEAAFGNCGLRSITFSNNSDLKINGNPFYSNDIVSFTVPKDHAWLATYQGVLFDKNEKKLISYAYAREGTTYEVPRGIRVIGKDAFEYCDLEKIVLPDTLLTIEDNAFLGCNSLKEIVIPDSVTTIGESAFDNCGEMESVYIGDGVVSVGDYAFAWCEGLQMIRIPDGLREAGEGAFVGSDALKCFILSEENLSFKLIDDVLFTGDGRRLLVYPGGKTEEAYDIPMGTEEIAEYAFHRVPALRSITTPESVKTIRSNVFYEMKNLEEVVFGEGLETIEEHAFLDCENIKMLTIPRSVRTIYNLGFDDNSSITVRVWHHTPAEGQGLIEGYQIEYLD